MRFVGYLWRGLVFLAVAGTLGVTYLGGEAALRLWHQGSSRAVALGRWRGKMMRVTASALGATFVKLGQVMSSRPDLFSPEFIAEVEVLQDRLPPFAFSRARRTIEADLGRPLAEVFSAFEEAPLAAASVAQVHRAQLQSGEDVAVKVLRPGVRAQIERDAVLLLGLARAKSWIGGLRALDPVGHLREFVDAILEQTDLRTEAINQVTFANNFAHQPDVHFPKIYSAACGPRVLTMELLRGEKIDQLAHNRSDVARLIREMMLQMCFVDGFVHADLHPGNFLVRDSKQLLVFDAGMAKRLPDNVLVLFIDFTRCLTSGTPADFIKHCQTYHTYVGEIDWSALGDEATAFIRTFRSQAIGSLEYGTMFADIFRIARKYGVRPVPELTLVMVAMLTAQGIGKQLEPDGNVFGEIARYLASVPSRRAARKEN